MKRILLALLMLPALVYGAGNDLFIQQRDPLNVQTLTRTVTSPAADAILGYAFTAAIPGNRVPVFFTLGSGLQLTGNVLSVPGAGAAPAWADITGKPSFATVATTGAYADLTGRPTIPAAQQQSDWLAVAGVTSIANKPSLAPVATSGAYADLSGKPALFSGAYADLTGVPSTFNPAAHTHAAGDIVSGTLATARLPALPISQTTGLQAALDSKFPAPTGSTAQYIRGDGSTAAFPALFSGAYGDLSGIPATFAPTAHTQAWSTITSTPTTLAGYGISDGVSQAALTTALGGYATTAALTSGLAGKFNTPTGTAAQYLRGDGSVATFPAIPGGTVTSITAGTGLAGGTITTTGTISLPNTGTAGSYANVTTDAQGRVTAGTNRSQSSVTRPLNTAFQPNTTRDVDARYSVQCQVTASITGGQNCDVFLDIATDQAFTQNVQQVGVVGQGQVYTLAVAIQGVQPQTQQVIGYIPAGYWARIRTVQNLGAPTFTYRLGQEILQ